MNGASWNKLEVFFKNILENSVRKQISGPTAFFIPIQKAPFSLENRTTDWFDLYPIGSFDGAIRRHTAIVPID